MASIPAPLDPSALLSSTGRFEVFGELGRGASAVVYDVFDRERDVRVALKLLYHRDLSARRRLEAELAVSREVSHPNLVRVHEVSDIDGVPFMVMERVLGTGISRYVGADRGAADETRLRSCLVQIVSALDALHAAHRVHRDVKPGNLRVTPEGRLVLLDFGITAEREDLVWAEPGVGTPAYMAPEQVSGGPVGPAADLYAVGAILYELLTGAVPHPEAQHGRPAVKLSVVPKAPSALDKNVSRELEILCLELLSRDPEGRPDAGQVLRRLGVPAHELRGRTIVRAPKGCIGRTQELKTLERAFERARERGFWLHVAGPRGRGKHALMEAFFKHISQSEQRPIVLRGRESVCEQRPFGALDQVMRDLVEVITQREIDCSGLSHASYITWLSQMFPGFGVLRTFRSVRGDDAPVPDLVERRRRAALLLREVIVKVAETGQIIACIEDFEGGALDAQGLLEDCFAGVAGVMVLTTGTRTSHESVRGAARELFELAPLTHDDAQALLSQMWQASIGAAWPEKCERLLAASAHEPWALIELARARLGLALDVEDPLLALSKRVASLSREGRELLCALSLFGRPVPQNVWLETADLEERVFHRLVFDLLERGYVVRQGGILDPRYELAHGQLEGPARKGADGEIAAMHANLARCHAARGLLEEHDRAFYLEQAGERSEAARVYEKASALSTARLAFCSAAECHRRALALDPPTDARGSTRLELLAQLLERSGDLTGAAHAYGRALEGAAPSKVFELKRSRTGLLLRALQLKEGFTSGREALLELGIRVPETEHNAALSLLYQKLLLGLRGTRFRAKEERRFSPLELSRIDALLGISHALSNVNAIGAAELQARGFRLALREREPRRVARALAQEAAAGSVEEPEPHTRSFARLKLARELSEGDPLLDAWIDIVEAIAHFFDLHPVRAKPLLDRAEKVFTDQADRPDPGRWIGKLLRLDVSSLNESFGELEARTNTALAEARLRGDHLMTSIVMMRGTFFLRLSRDCDPDAALAVIDEAMAKWPRDQIYMQHFFELQMRGLAAQQRGEPGALARFEADRLRLEPALFMRARLVRNVLEGTRAGLLAVEIAAADPSERAPLLKQLRRSLKSIGRRASGIGRMLPAFLAGTERWLSDDPEAALACFKQTLALADERELTRLKSYASVLVGHLQGGDEGRAMRTAAVEAMRADGCRDPEQLLRTFIPELKR